MNKIALVPLDNRPCNTQFPVKIAAMCGWDILLPDNNIIGTLTIQGNREKLTSWLLNSSADGIVVSIDMLGFGGLVFSRKSNENDKDIFKYIDVLKKIKEKNKAVQILAYNTIMRISNSNDNTEEKDYWKEYGQLIYKYSVLYHKNTLDISTADELENVKKEIPEKILYNYLRGRERSFHINHSMMEYVKNSYFDFLVLNADDTSQYGINVIEKHKLELLEKQKYSSEDEKIMIYCGADEISLLLIARLMNKHYNSQPKFYPVYSHENSYKHLTMYEDCPLGETLKNQIASIGGVIVDDADSADCHLFIYTPYKKQGDLFLHKHMPKNLTPPPQEFLDKIKSALESGKTVGLIDAAYANGADDIFMTELSNHINLAQLTSFGAWNTTANTIGTVISTCSSYINAKNSGTVNEKMRLEFLFERLSDDWLYQNKVRLNAKKNNMPLKDTADILKDYAQKLFEYQFMGKLVNDYQINTLKNLEISFPWNRYFEVGVDCRF